jgi:hypothetical protein
MGIRVTDAGGNAIEEQGKQPKRVNAAANPSQSSSPNRDRTALEMDWGYLACSRRRLDMIGGANRDRVLMLPVAKDVLRPILLIRAITGFVCS